MSGKTLKLIQLVSERDQGVASFKEAILSEAFNPASQSSPARSPEQLGAGIPLAPEALIELEHEGYMQKVPYKVMTVTKLAQREVEKIFRLRVKDEGQPRASHTSSAPHSAKRQLNCRPS